MKRTTFTAAVALLALAVLQGQALADGTDGTGGTGGTPAGSGPPAVWQPAGKPLSGAATTADAPPMLAATSYRDGIKPGETKYYGIALDATSSAYVSAFAVPTAGSQVIYRDGIELTLLSPADEECDSAEAHFQDDDARPIGTAVSRIIGVSTACQEANQYILQVHRASDGTSDPGVWPLELRYVLEPALKAGAAVRPAPATGSASPTRLTTGSPRQADGGTSFENAAPVRTGIWKDKVPPGETRFYKVPVDWGQRATVFADFSSTTVTSASAYVPSGVRLAAYSPVRELINDQDASYDGGPASISEQLAPVSYANRNASDEEVEPVRYAGWYYFAVTVHPQVATAVRGPVPVTLRVDVSGAAQPGPAYDGSLRQAGLGIDAQDLSSANGMPGGSSPGTSGLRFLAFAALGAGTVLLLSLAAWFASARRRAAGETASRESGYGSPSVW